MTLVTVFVLISAFFLAPQYRWQESQRRIAGTHLERARDLELEKNPKAEDEYKLAIRAMGGKYPEALRDLCFYLRRHLRFSESAVQLSRYIAQTPREEHGDDIEELNELREAARLKIRVYRFKKPLLRDLVEYSRLVSRYADNQSLDALPYAERAVRLYPNSANAYENLARVLVRPGQDERRCRALRKAIELGASSSTMYFDLANCELVTGHTQEAVDAFRKTLNISNGKLTDAYEGLGFALGQLGRREEAIGALRTYLEQARIPEQQRSQVEQRIKRYIEKLEKNQ
jgi:predicted Zn-dependent protease